METRRERERREHYGKMLMEMLRELEPKDARWTPLSSIAGCLKSIIEIVNTCFKFNHVSDENINELKKNGNVIFNNCRREESYAAAALPSLFVCIKYGCAWPSKGDDKYKLDNIYRIEYPIVRAIECILEVPEKSFDSEKIRSFESLDRLTSEAARYRSLAGLEKEKQQESLNALKRLEQIDGLLATVQDSGSVDEQIIGLRNLTDDYKTKLAYRLAKVINSKIEHLVLLDGSFEKKREIAKWVNEELRNQGLVIRCEVPDQDDPSVVQVYPAFLVADNSRASDREGRFRLEYQDESGKHKRVAFAIGPNALALMVPSPPNIPSQTPATSNSFTDRFPPKSGRTLS